jgi:cation transport ATPase
MIFGKKKISIEKQGLFQALGVAAYCTLIGLLMANGNILFGQMNLVIGPILMLILLSVSVLVCGLLVFYQPYQLFFDGKKKEAVDLVLFTTGWLVMFFFAFLILTVIIN